MKSKQNIFEIVDDDPDFDYEYYDNHDFGDEMEEADKKGELFRGWELGGGNFWESIDNMSAILAAKRAGVTEGPITVPYPPCPAAETYPRRPEWHTYMPYPLPETMMEPELCVAEEPETKYA